MPSLEEYRQEWLGVRGSYARFGTHVEGILRAEIRKAGVLAVVDSRAKPIDSFLKKTIRKGYQSPMDDMHDKAGARVIVPFITQLSVVGAIVRQQFDVRKFEDKLEGLGKDKFAYQSWHYDVILKEPLTVEAEEFRGWWCEIQLRTESQNLWAEMAHRLLYKSEQQIPDPDARRVHRLNALLEIADYEFEATRDAVSRLPGAWALRVLTGLEGLYYELTGKSFDRELSLEVLEHLRPLCPQDPQLAVDETAEWVRRHRQKVETIVVAYSENPDRALFLFQPEGLLMAAQLEKDPFTLRERWMARFPEEELKRLSTIMAIPYVD